MQAAQTSKELQHFLQCWDLDDALHAASKLKNLTEEHKESIRQLLTTKWTEDQQAVANLLQNAWLISPPAFREDVFIRALQDPNPYFVLSAAVGCQDQTFSEPKGAQIKNLLLRTILSTVGPIANRAWTSLASYLHFPNDVATVLNLVDHIDKSLRKNARSWLVDKFQKAPEHDLIVALNMRQNLPEEVVNAIVKIHRDYRSGKLLFLGGALTYIPNFNEYARLAAYREYLNSLFLDLDENKDGMVGWKELQAFFVDLGKNMTQAELEKMVQENDDESKGGLDLGDWFQLMDGKLHVTDDVLSEFGDLSLGGADLPSDLQGGGADAIFDMFDADKDGKINARDLKLAMLAMGQDITDDEAAAMLQSADLDKDGVLNKEEFTKFLKNL